MWCERRMVYVEEIGQVFSVGRDDSDGSVYVGFQEHLSSPHLWSPEQFDRLLEALDTVRNLAAVAGSRPDWIESLGFKGANSAVREVC